MGRLVYYTVSINISINNSISSRVEVATELMLLPAKFFITGKPEPRT